MYYHYQYHFKDESIHYHFEMVNELASFLIDCSFGQSTFVMDYQSVSIPISSIAIQQDWYYRFRYDWLTDSDHSFKEWFIAFQILFIGPVKYSFIGNHHGQNHMYCFELDLGHFWMVYQRLYDLVFVATNISNYALRFFPSLLGCNFFC